MNKKIWVIIALIIIILIGVGIFFYFQTNTPAKTEENYEVNRTAVSNTFNEENTTSLENDKQQSSTNQTKHGITETENKQTPKTEEQIATFATKIYSTDKARQNNINITCNTLNDTIVKTSETFSFCNTVGQASTSRGYQKADIFDKNGNKKKGLGGRKLSN